MGRLPLEAHIVLLDAGHATLEIIDERQTQAIDEIEVGRRVAGRVRIAFRSSDSESAANTLAAAGAEILAGPITTHGVIATYAC
jgi:hypothetical protein